MQHYHDKKTRYGWVTLNEVLNNYDLSINLHDTNYECK